MIQMPSGDARKRIREPRVRAMFPFLLAMFTVWVMKLVDAFDRSPSHGWFWVVTVPLLAVTLYVLVNALDTAFQLHHRSVVRKAAGDVPIFLCSVSIDTWNQNVQGIRDTLTHPNYLPMVYLLLENDAITVRTGFRGDSDSKCEVLYNQVDEVKAVKVSTVMSSGPGIRIIVGTEQLDFQLFPHLNLGPVHSSWADAEKLVLLIAGRITALSLPDPNQERGS